jgi:hypothetical protein
MVPNAFMEGSDLPSLPQVLAENGLPGVPQLSKGERVMLERKRLERN